DTARVRDAARSALPRRPDRHEGPVVAKRLGRGVPRRRQLRLCAREPTATKACGGGSQRATKGSDRDRARNRLSDRAYLDRLKAPKAALSRVPLGSPDHAESVTTAR